MSLITNLQELQRLQEEEKQAKKRYEQFEDEALKNELRKLLDSISIEKTEQDGRVIFYPKITHRSFAVVYMEISKARHGFDMIYELRHKTIGIKILIVQRGSESPYNRGIRGDKSSIRYRCIDKIESTVNVLGKEYSITHEIPISKYEEFFYRILDSYTIPVVYMRSICDYKNAHSLNGFYNRFPDLRSLSMEDISSGNVGVYDNLVISIKEKETSLEEELILNDKDLGVRCYLTIPIEIFRISVIYKYGKDMSREFRENPHQMSYYVFPEYLNQIEEETITFKKFLEL